MRSIEEIEKGMEQIKTQLTRETDQLGIAHLQGQYSSLEWVITLDEKSGGGEQQ